MFWFSSSCSSSYLIFSFAPSGCFKVSYLWKRIKPLIAHTVIFNFECRVVSPADFVFVSMDKHNLSLLTLLKSSSSSLKPRCECSDIVQMRTKNTVGFLCEACGKRFDSSDAFHQYSTNGSRCGWLRGSHPCYVLDDGNTKSLLVATKRKSKPREKADPATEACCKFNYRQKNSVIENSIEAGILIGGNGVHRACLTAYAKNALKMCRCSILSVWTPPKLPRGPRWLPPGWSYLQWLWTFFWEGGFIWYLQLTFKRFTYSLYRILMHDIPNTNCTHPAYNVPLIQINSLATVFWYPLVIQMMTKAHIQADLALIPGLDYPNIANYDPDPTSPHHPTPDFPGPHSGPDTFMSLPKSHILFLRYLQSIW